MSSSAFHELGFPCVFVSSSRVVAGTPFSVVVVVGASWRAAHGLSPVSVFEAGRTAVTVIAGPGLEHKGQRIDTCTRCCRRLAVIGWSDAVKVGPVPTGESDLEAYTFDACCASCTSTKLHMRIQIAFAFCFPGLQFPVLSPPFDTISRASTRRPQAAPVSSVPSSSSSPSSSSTAPSQPHPPEGNDRGEESMTIETPQRQQPTASAAAGVSEIADVQVQVRRPWTQSELPVFDPERSLSTGLFIVVRSGFTMMNVDEAARVFENASLFLRYDHHFIGNDRHFVQLPEGGLYFTTVGIWGDRRTAENAYLRVVAIYRPFVSAGRTVVKFERKYW